MNSIASQEKTTSTKSENWHALSAEEVLEHLKVQDNGLTEAEAAEEDGALWTQPTDRGAASWVPETTLGTVQ